MTFQNQISSCKSLNEEIFVFSLRRLSRLGVYGTFTSGAFFLFRSVFRILTMKGLCVFFCDNCTLYYTFENLFIHIFRFSGSISMKNFQDDTYCLLK